MEASVITTADTGNGPMDGLPPHDLRPIIPLLYRSTPADSDRAMQDYDNFPSGSELFRLMDDIVRKSSVYLARSRALDKRLFELGKKANDVRGDEEMFRTLRAAMNQARKDWAVKLVIFGFFLGWRYGRGKRPHV